MNGDLLLPAALVGIAGVGVLRWSWARSGRSAALNVAGWALMALAVVLGAFAGGAWGIAVASLFPMSAAAVLLGWAAVSAPRGKGQASERRVRMLPEPGEKLRLGSRALTFFLIVVGGLAASIALAIGLRGGALLLHWSEADANALALIAVPLVWGVLATVLLMQERRSTQIATIAIASVPLLPALLTGS